MADFGLQISIFSHLLRVVCPAQSRTVNSGCTCYPGRDHGMDAVQWIIIPLGFQAPESVAGWEVAQRIGSAFNGLLVAPSLFDLLKIWIVASASG